MDKSTNKNKMLKKVCLKGLSVSLSVLTVTAFPVNAAEDNTANNQPAAQETKQEISLKEKIGKKLKAIANNRAVRIAVSVAAGVGIAYGVSKVASKVNETGERVPLPEGIKDNQQYLNAIRRRLRSIKNDVRQLQDNVSYGNRLWRPLFNCGNNMENLLYEIDLNIIRGNYLTAERLERINAQVVGFLENMRDLRNDSRRDPQVDRRLRNICDDLVRLANFTGSNILLDDFWNIPVNPPVDQPEPQPVDPSVAQLNQIRIRIMGLNTIVNLLEEREETPIRLSSLLDSIRTLLDTVNMLPNLNDGRRDVIRAQVMSIIQIIRILYDDVEIRRSNGVRLSNMFNSLEGLAHIIDPNLLIPPLQHLPEPQPVNPPVIHPVAQLPETYQLGETNGLIYIQNMITRQVVNIFDERTIGNKLRELCTQFDITRGTHSADSIEGWERTPYQYYFDTTQVDENGRIMSNVHLYASLSDTDKELFAQTIKLMYDHKDEENWQGAIRTVLLGLCEHDGHCSWRATGLVHQAYNDLLTNIKNDNLDPDGSTAVRDNMFLLNEVFSNLKETIVKDVRNLYMEDHRDDWEPLNAANDMESIIKRMLGINNGAIDDEQRRRAMPYFNRIMTKDKIIELSHDIIDSKFDENHNTELVEFFEDVDPVELNFTEYCDMVGKTNENKGILRETINNSDDNDLKEWVNDRQRLKVGDASEEDLGFISKLMDLSYDFNSIGCPEINKIYGVKFVIKCITYNYLE